MYQNVGFNQFIDGFKSCGRETSFTYEGFRKLYDHLIEVEEETGQKMEFDPVSIDCDYFEYTEADFKEDYSELDADERDDLVVARYDGLVLVRGE